MKCLAWDTSDKAGAVCAFEILDGIPQVRAEIELDVNAQHSERLLWAIDQTIRTAGWKLPEVELFGVGIGPGSFTGLRIGCVTARTLAHSCSKPLVGVSSLALLSQPILDRIHALNATQNASLNPIVIAVTDACKGEVFIRWGRALEIQGEGLPQEQVVRPEDWVKEILQTRHLDGGWIMGGRARALYPEVWAKLPSQYECKEILESAGESVGRATRSVSPSILAQEVSREFLKNGAKPALEVHPHYLRDSDAQVRLRKGLLKAQPLS